MSTSDIINDSITPFVQRILSDPLHFKPAKHTEMVTHSPVNYIKLGTSQPKNQTAQGSKDTKSSNSSPKIEKHRSLMPRITSLAQAIAGYTNKRKIDDAPEKKTKKAKKATETKVLKKAISDDIGESLDKEEDSQKDSNMELASSSDDEDQYEDANALPFETPLNLISKKVFEQFDSKSGTSDSNSEENKEEDIATEDTDEEDDEDFNDESSEDSEISDSESLNEDQEDAEFVESNISPSADKENSKDDSSETESKTDEEDNSELKKDLLDDQRQQLTTSVTPPTSPDSDVENASQSEQIHSKLDNFYQLGESRDDRGSNNSNRIWKNWGPKFIDSKPGGLLNHGVTCYTNAAVQAMVHIPAVQHYLVDILKNKYRDVINPRSVSHVLAETSAKMWNLDSNKVKKSKIVNPTKLIGRLDEINCMMSQWQQEDSHEYFMSLLSRLQEDSTPKGHKLNESIIYDIFGGLLNQSVTCKNCGHISKTNQEFYDLSLHLGNSRKNSQSSEGNTLPQEEETTNHRYSIQKSIKDFFSPELIKTDKTDKSGYVCENCKQRTNAIKISSIDRAPETLTVHLKRFRFNGSSSSKVKQGVSYPSMLDLSQYTTNGENVLYQLISVIVHEGRSVSSGHYVAHCRQPDGTWATYDDEYINSVSEAQVLRDPSAYYLIYTRLTGKEHQFPKTREVTKASKVPEIKVSIKSSQTSSTPSSPISPKKKPIRAPIVKKKNKRLAIIGLQPTNNLVNTGSSKIQKKYTRKGTKGGRFKKY